MGSKRVCFAASELFPFAKTGGLADVAGALPRHLHRAGHDVRVFVPLYGQIDRRGHEFHGVDFLRNFPVTSGNHTFQVSVLTARFPGSDLWIYFVDCPELYHRSALYTSDPDEPRRFAVFSAAVLACCQRMGWAPQVFHCNDWHTALLPFLRRTTFAWDELFGESKTILTIHNIGYQGSFSTDWIGELGLADWSHLLDHEELKAGRFGFLRTGLIYADVLTTVSPTYAREIQSPPYGMGLEGLLRARSDHLVGILNGVDYEEWSPENDRLIPHRYSRGRMAGKRKNKRYLQEQLGLDGDTRWPLVGIVSRLTHQKGFDLCFQVLPELLGRRGMRLAVLGSGEARYEDFFHELERRFPGRVVFYRGYNHELAHLIEAGADLFLMPSRYEPCGLNQMFSQRYGTIPIVRRTGGLADSVEPFDPERGRGTGFVFEHFTPEGLHWALDLALRAYEDRSLWRRLVGNAMAQDYSWERRTRSYEQLYDWLAN